MTFVDYKNWKNQSSLEVLKTFAIEAAVACDWPEAAKINHKIISTTEGDVEALNRLARAQACCGELSRSLKTYKKVLDIDPYNIIARKNFEKLSKLEKINGHGKVKGNSTASTQMPTGQKLSDIFLFEPRKTKIINLLNLATPFVLAMLNCGDKVEFVLKKHGICISNSEGTYLGALPDDLAHKLLSYIQGGNKYEAYVKYATTKNLTVFIREVERSAKFSNQPSFSSSQSDEKNLAFA